MPINIGTEFLSHIPHDQSWAVLPTKGLLAASLSDVPVFAEVRPIDAHPAVKSGLVDKMSFNVC